LLGSFYLTPSQLLLGFFVGIILVLLQWSCFGIAAWVVLPWCCRLGLATLVLPSWYCCLDLADLVLLPWLGLCPCLGVCAICLSSRQVFLAVVGWHLLCECVQSSVYTTSILWFNRLYTLSGLIFLVVPDPGAL
jgi:hypothetical protein